MANFMGPMAPPQAAPNAPPQLDIRTNPSQRAQFKEFMQGMNRPVMPPTTAPIAPMLPAPMPSPMDQIDIFAPAPMANSSPMPMPMQMPAPMPMQSGIMGAVPFEDGGPVGMFLGGDPQAYGEERGRQDTSETARERVGGTTNVFEGDSAPGGGDDDGDSLNEAVDAAIQAGIDTELLGMSQDAQRAASTPVNLFPGSSTLSNPVGSMGVTDTDEAMAPALFVDEVNVGDAQRLAGELMGMRAGDFNFGIGEGIDPVFSPLGVVESLIGPQPRDVGPADQSVIDFINRNPQPPADSGVRTAPPPTSDPYGMPGDPDPALIQDQAFDRAIGNMFATPVTVKTARGNVTSTALDDLTRRMGGKIDTGDKSSNMFGGIGKVVVDALLGVGRKKAEDIFTNIESGRPGVIDAETGQIQGYIGDNILGFGRAYTGRAGYDPFAIGADATFDPSRNAFIVNRQQENGGEDAQQRNRASGQAPATPPPATDPADTTPPPLMIGPPTTGLPPSGPSPTDVLVPSTRTNVPVTVPSILPTEGLAPTVLPQSFLDLLASFNRPAPVAMQDGGAVLDKAADNFLEALKVA